MTSGVGSLNIKTAGTEEEAVKGLKAALGMDMEVEGKV